VSKLVVYRASAGSGKTYRLTVEYLKQILKNPESYKNILAVTFTNKATAEMKGRILDELFSLSLGEKTKMYNEISEAISLRDDLITKRAKLALSMILHDYTRFSVSTIDSFVQRVIQALLWEIGEKGGVDIKLETKPVIEKAADNLIDSTSQFDDLMHWIIRMGESQIDEGKSWDIRYSLVRLGSELFAESFRLMDKEEIKRFTDRKNIEKLKDAIEKLMVETFSQIKPIALEALGELERRGLEIDQFSNKSKGVMGIFLKCSLLEPSEPSLPEYGKFVINALEDSSGENWVNKDTFKNKAEFDPIQQAVSEVLHPLLVRLVALVDEKSKKYVTAKLIQKNLENLALIGDLWKKIKELSKDEGFLLLSDSNHLLREFVKENDTPFIYEKVGCRYDSFMIDEFQDTSVVQWHNFKPLIDNSLSQDCFSMIVGDVKQSIYRWRNGDWNILASGVENDFAHQGIDERFLNINRRSLPAIVNFNNHFFKSAVELISNQIGSEAEKVNQSFSDHIKKQITTAYKDYHQESQYTANASAGNVEVNFIKCNDRIEYLEKLSIELPALIEKLKKNFSLGDIAILVSKHKDGQQIANIFLDHNRAKPSKADHITFVSQEGLLLKASSLVRLVISAFRLVENPRNEVAQRVLVKEINCKNPQDNPTWHSHFVENDFIKQELTWLNELITRPLQEAFEEIANRYKLFSHSQELAYLAELHEHILALSGKGGSDVGQFLYWWDENSPKLSLSVPESSDAISILTIHKSKGLEFPVVIIPFADWYFKTQGKTSLLWVSTHEKPFDILPCYPIYATKEVQKSLFAQEVIDEDMKVLVDNLNKLYVAFTRPQNELYIYTQCSEDKKEKKEGSSINNVSMLLEKIIPAMGKERNDIPDEEGFISENQYRFGNPSAQILRVSSKQTNDFHWKINSYPVGINHENMKLRMEAGEFFCSIPSDKLSQREHGKLMHEAFSLIETVNDIDIAIHKLCTSGIVGNNEKEHISNRIKELLSHDPMKSWFSGEWQTKTEATIITPGGQNYRPDRVMIKGNIAVVVDFKFGVPSDSHKSQITRYANLLKEMGYSKTSSYIWYVDENDLVTVQIGSIR
jgi:ATP-dependent exoDNAse (exonuclease V) beta subunit